MQMLKALLLLLSMSWQVCLHLLSKHVLVQNMSWLHTAAEAEVTACLHVRCLLFHDLQVMEVRRRAFLPASIH
jgi:hypothetical protein